MLRLMFTKSYLELGNEDWFSLTYDYRVSPSVPIGGWHLICIVSYFVRRP